LKLMDRLLRAQSRRNVPAPMTTKESATVVRLTPSVVGNSLAAD
jgi:hypothetical protein